MRLTAIALVLASFSWANPNYVGSSDLVLDSSAVFGRILPIVITIVLCSITSLDRSRFFASWFRLPGGIFLFFATIGVLSTLINGFDFQYSVWKAVEIIAVVVWGGYIWTYLSFTHDYNYLRKVFMTIHWTLYVLVLWILYSELLINPSALQNLLSGRLGGRLPLVNPIQLGFLAGLNLFVFFVIIGKSKGLRIGLIALLMIPSGIVLIWTQSRTGALGFILAVLLIAMIRARKPLPFVALFMILIFGGFFLAQSEQWSYYWTRDLSFQTALSFSGRVNITWAESIDLIIKSPLIGYGLLNVARFSDALQLAADSTFLQALLTAGIIGGLPFVVLIVGYMLRWIALGIRAHSNAVLVELGLGITVMIFVRMVFVNELVFYSVGLMLFILLAQVFDPNILKDISLSPTPPSNRLKMRSSTIPGSNRCPPRAEVSR